MQAQQPAASGGGGGFLKGALATAAGVAGGALIYDQMKGMFGGGSGQAHASSTDPGQAEADRYQDEGQDAQAVDDDEQDFNSDSDSGGDSGGGDLDI